MNNLLKAMLPKLHPALRTTYSAYLERTCKEWGIHTPAQISAFLAILIVESRGFTKWRTERLGLEHEGNADLGNVFPGDGFKFKEGGLLPIVGRTQYRRAARGIKYPRLATYPNEITAPGIAIQVAGWLWSKELGLNDLTVTGTQASILAAFNILHKGRPTPRRRAVVKYWKCARKALGLT